MATGLLPDEAQTLCGRNGRIELALCKEKLLKKGEAGFWSAPSDKCF